MLHISDMARRLSIAYFWGLLVLSVLESSISAIMCIFSSFLVFKLNRSILQIILIISDQLFSDHYLFWSSVDIEVIFNSDIFWKVNFNSCSFFRCFFWPICKLSMSGLYIIPYFGYGLYFIWECLVLAFIKTASVTTIYFFQQFFMI